MNEHKPNTLTRLSFAILMVITAQGCSSMQKHGQADEISSGRHDVGIRTQAMPSTTELDYEVFVARKGLPVTDPNRVGALLYNSGDLDMAEKMFLRAIQDNPKQVLAKANLGVLYYVRKDYHSAVGVLDAVYEHHPEFAQASLAYGGSLCESGRAKEGEAAIYTAMSYLDGGDFQRAGRMLKECIVKEAVND